MKRLSPSLRISFLVACTMLFLFPVVSKFCWAASLPEDLNGDGSVNVKDIAIAAAAFSSYPGHERWNPKADINADGRVDLADVGLIILRFGTHQPVAIFTASAQVGPVGATIEFDPSSSYDPDGIITLYEWDWDGDGIYDNATVFPDVMLHVYEQLGTYNVTLRITDNDGLTDTMSALKTILPAGTVESCDSGGTTKDVFDIPDTLYIIGGGYTPGTYDLYVIEDATLGLGDPIPARVPGTDTSVTGPFLEELSKGFVLFLLFLMLPNEFDGLLDGLIYGALVGIGFAMVENVKYL